MVGRGEGSEAGALPTRGFNGSPSAGLSWGVGGVPRCEDPANQWDGREEEDGKDRGRLGLTWQAGQCGRWRGRGERSPRPAPCPFEDWPLG